MRRPLWLGAMLLIATAALAGDRPSATPAGDELLFATQPTVFGTPAVHFDVNPRGYANRRTPASSNFRRNSIAALDGDTCYTMRTYKVQRSERTSDETNPRGYTTCQMASGYRVRSTERQIELELNVH